MSHSRFVTRIGIDYPIVQAPMAGGATTPQLVAAVSNAGGLGSFAAATLPAQAIIDGARQIRALTSRPFNVNLFVLKSPQIGNSELAPALARLASFRSALGLPEAQRPEKFCEDPDEQLAALLEAAPPVVSFTFGLLDASAVARFQRAGSLLIGTATTVAEARAWEEVGADFICAQGAEAGAHRGTFLGGFEESCIGLMALIPQMAAAVRRPVIAAGGIMDGRGIAAALILGAQAAQLGTAFLDCPESGISAPWRGKLRAARDDSTRLTRTFSGRHARGIVNRYMEDMRRFEDDVPAYPIQNALTGEIRQAAARLGRPEFMSLWAGQGVAMLRSMPAAELVRTLVDELHAVLPQAVAPRAPPEPGMQ